MAPSTRGKKTPMVSPYFNKKTEQVKTIKSEQVDIKTIIKNEEYLEEKKDLVEVEDKGVPDILDDDLKVLFVGINPGITSAARGHHYAGPTNHFWPCLTESGLVNRKVTFHEDVNMPALYRLGFTNLTARTTRSASDLALSEQRDGIPILNAKFEAFRPRIACFVGKGIYEIYSRKKCKEMGLQSRHSAVKWGDGKGETLIFVMPSTSGLVTAYQKPDKIK